MTSTILSNRIQPAIFVVVIIVLGLSCKKKVDLAASNNNEIKAFVRYKSGKQVDIYATSNKARIGCGGFGGGRYVEAYDEINGSLSLSSLICLNSVGNYNNVLVRFTPQVNLALSPVYDNPIVTYPGGPIYLSIFMIKTFTADYIEGAFSSMAWYKGDTVLISGTFKGDYFQ